MLPQRNDLPLFAGTEDAEQLFLATMDALEDNGAEVIDIKDPLWRYLKKRNLIEYVGTIGTEVRIAVMDKENNTVKFHTGYDDVDNTPQDALGVIQYLYGQIVGTQMYNREEMVKNSGEYQVIDLVKKKTKQLELSMTNLVATWLKGTQVADGRKFTGLGNLVAHDTASGGVDPTEAGKDWWNPQLIYKTGTTPFALATELRAGLRKLYRATAYFGTKPDVLLCGEDVYDAQQAWAENLLRLSMDEIKDSSGWGDFNMFTVNGSTVIYDANMGAKVAWALNFQDCARVRIHKGTNFTFEPWQMMPNKVAKKRDCLLYMNVYAEDRRGLGTITFS
jgi:hypothetical protein